MFWPFGATSTARRANEQVVAAFASNCALVLRGESHLLNWRLAAAIHHHGRTSGNPLEYVVCGQCPDALVASELVGHRAGAFAGALRDKRGALCRADDGTVVLTDVGSFGELCRAVLSHFVRTGEVRPLGAPPSSHRTRVRLILTTVRPLDASVQDAFPLGALLNIEVPPLPDYASVIVALSGDRVTSNDEGRSTPRLVTASEQRSRC